jgi:hypothetical protein
MKKFLFLADTIIEAENIDDCCAKLSAHFFDVSGSDLEHEGILSIKPLEDENESSNN